MLEIKLLPNSEVEIIGEISAEIFMSGRDKDIKKFFFPEAVHFSLFGKFFNGLVPAGHKKLG